MVVKSIGIIGAGAAGLAALRRFGAREKDFKVVCFEQLPNVAGLWNYCENITDSKHPTGSKYTAVYKNLKTNLPKQIMAFPEFPFSPDLPSYIMHYDVKKYLDDFAEQFNLKRLIKFHKQVKSVCPKSVLGQDDRWLITVVDVHTKLEEEYEFDAVIVCSGHFSKPFYPKIEDFNRFKGMILHSQCYRDPEEFKGKNVLLVGGGHSGIDIACDVFQSAGKTWLSHRSPTKLALPEAIQQIGEVTKFAENSVFTCSLQDQPQSLGAALEKMSCLGPEKICRNESNSETDVHNLIYQPSHAQCSKKSASSNSVTDKICEIGPIDVVIFCTGFSYSYPFLASDCGAAVLSPLSVGPLYKEVICISRPTLSFIGLPARVLPFPLFDCQAQFLLAIFEGRLSLPSYGPEMTAEVKAWDDKKAENGIDLWLNPLEIGMFQWSYMRALAKLGSFEPVPHYYEDLYRRVTKERPLSFLKYKLKEYTMGKDGLLVEII